jgi:polyisoprenyl-teichoic acid--peptidoglycan teichoic acid transferase
MNSDMALRGTALGGAALVLLSGVLAARSPVAKDLRTGRPLTGIVLGTDLVDFARHSDTLMVWRYHPGRAELDVLSIPRDTRVDLPGYRFRRINEVFAYHFGVKQDHGYAASMVMEAVNALLSTEGSAAATVSALHPRYYMHVDYDGFRRLVDLLGGVQVRVDEPLHYDDYAGNYHVHMDPGPHHLDGSKALDYVRFRGRSGDRGRIMRQMEFLKALADRLTSPMLFLRWPQILIDAIRIVQTNLAPADFLFLAVEGKYLRPGAIHPWLLPGRPKGAYWEMDRERLSTVLARMAGQAESAAGSATVKVKVWNATARSGLALEATRRLRAAGFDVLEWGNYNGRQLRTRVLDRMGDIEKANSVARELGADFVLSDVNPKLQTDVEVILGDDYQ